MKKFLVFVSLFSVVVILTGCDNKEADAEEARYKKERAAREQLENAPEEGRDFLSGTVTKIYGNLPGLEASTISVTGKHVSGGGETIKIGEPIYGLQVQTTKGLYVLQLAGNHVYALASLINVGTEVKFPRKFHWARCTDEVDLFGANNINFGSGVLQPDLSYLLEIVPQK